MHAFNWYSARIHVCMHACIIYICIELDKRNALKQW
jgi:hypothetical protein